MTIKVQCNLYDYIQLITLVSISTTNTTAAASTTTNTTAATATTATTTTTTIASSATTTSTTDTGTNIRVFSGDGQSTTILGRDNTEKSCSHQRGGNQITFRIPVNNATVVAQLTLYLEPR